MSVNCWLLTCQLTTIFWAKYQLTTNFLANCQLTTNPISTLLNFCSAAKTLESPSRLTHANSSVICLPLVCSVTMRRKESITSKRYLFLFIYRIFTAREVRIGKNCARGLEYGPRPQAEGRTQGVVLDGRTRGSDSRVGLSTDRPRQVNNIFIFFQHCLQVNLKRL